jgi:hypothetical protein
MGDRMKCLTTRLGRGETILFLALLLVLPVRAVVSAQGAPHRAGLVIRFGDGSVITRCVSFSEPSITGMELLARAGLSIRVDTASSIGAGVCKINSQGCDAGQSCFCQCTGSTCAYWQYFHVQNGAWKYSILGAALYPISDGAVEGWAWGNNVAPPLMALDQICASTSALAPTSAPQATRALSRTPAPTSRPVTLTAAATVAPVTASASPTLVPTDAPATALALSTLALASPTVATASPASAPTVPASPQNAGGASPVTSYAIFGVIVLGLGTWLLIQSRRKAR